MIERDLTDPDGIILVRGSGIWTEADVDYHYEQLRLVIDDRRKQGLAIRVLSDVTKAQRQTPDIEARAMWQMNQTYQAGDRVAMLVADADVKQYVRTMLGNAYIATFSSRLPAEMWLLYDGLEPPGF